MSSSSKTDGKESKPSANRRRTDGEMKANSTRQRHTPSVSSSTSKASSVSSKAKPESATRTQARMPYHIWTKQEKERIWDMKSDQALGRLVRAGFKTTDLSLVMHRPVSAIQERIEALQTTRAWEPQANSVLTILTQQLKLSPVVIANLLYRTEPAVIDRLRRISSSSSTSTGAEGTPLQVSVSTSVPTASRVVSTSASATLVPTPTKGVKRKVVVAPSTSAPLIKSTTKRSVPSKSHAAVPKTASISVSAKKRRISPPATAATVADVELTTESIETTTKTETETIGETNKLEQVHATTDYVDETDAVDTDVPDGRGRTASAAAEETPETNQEETAGDE